MRIKRTDLLPEVSQQTFERMKAERLAEAAQLRARGTELAARIRAEADREAVVTVAEAEREAEILRGEGDAERSRIFAEAYQQDPDFFEFYRSMRAYDTSLNGTGTTLVLSPDSEFLRFFQNAGGGALPQGSGPPTPARAERACRRPLCRQPLPTAAPADGTRCRRCDPGGAGRPPPRCNEGRRCRDRADPRVGRARSTRSFPTS